MKRLIVLDLDNTLIYCTYTSVLKANKLFKYMDLLYVYERPFAREFIERCHKLGDVMIFTMSELDYAQQISEHLNIQPLEIFSNVDCLFREGVSRKRLPDEYYNKYDEIIIVDDYPECWEIQDKEMCRIIVPIAFPGDEKDIELTVIMEKQLDFSSFDLKLRC